MREFEKKHGFMDIIKGWLTHITKIISSSISSPIAEATEMVMNNIESRIIQIEKRIMRHLSSLLIILFGGVFLTFAFFFFLIDFLGWNNATALFFIGIIFFVIGLILKVRESNN